ncbi:hypothetical protein DND132_1928 [Pseudodesulfovibrio mercurii]|uniref:Uncharacterized protein n=1 Tax=Pseudodesulfovibrio mercurii TaxID=641491 RepID=F0JGU4_9BACT|nr:hypothetical protein [Pseudodesulfovibrio mercurii]EGB15134.1 hypothetical protein DND132_1928 [Pseudodesulfovibrio mercurii]
MPFVLMFVGFLVLMMVAAGTEDEWEGKIKKPVGIALLVVPGTWLFWWLADIAEGTAVILGSPLILLVMAVLVRLFARRAFKWFWWGVLVFVLASVLLIPMAGLLERVPSWSGYDVSVTLEADTPDGPRSASGICRLTGNLFGTLVRGGGGGHTLSMDPLTLDLGEGRSVTLTLGPNPGTVSVPGSGVGGAVKRSLVSGKDRGRFVNAMRPVHTARNGREVRVIRPQDFAAFFGPGYRFQRMTLRWPEE